MYGIAQRAARENIRRALRAERRARKQARMEAEQQTRQWQPEQGEIVWIRRFVDGMEIVSVGKVITPNHLEWDANGQPVEGVLVNAIWGKTWDDRAGRFVPRSVRMIIPHNDVAAHAAGAAHAA